MNGRIVIRFRISVRTLIGAMFLYHYPEEQTWIRVVEHLLLLCAHRSYAVFLSLIISNIAGLFRLPNTALAGTKYSHGEESWN